MRRLALIAVGTFLLSSCSPADMITLAWGPDGQHAVDQALKVGRCESGLDPSSVRDNPRSHEIGIMRFNVGDARDVGYSVTEDELADPWTNIAIAHDIWRAFGWRRWACRP